MSSMPRASVKELRAIDDDVAACRLCPRMVAHREKVAREKTRRFADQTYWGRAVPSFGDRRVRLLVVGLAPAAHGANRTGRMFTGDRSGDWLYEALHRHGFANQSVSVSREDGLRLDEARVSAVAHCAPPDNKPSREEVARCRAFFVREIHALPELRVVVALGKIAFDGFLDAWKAAGHDVPRPKPGFRHGARERLSAGPLLLASYHPSQQNTFTGRLTRPMFHRVFRTARSELERARKEPGK